MAFDQVVLQFGIRKQPRISNRISAVSSSSRTAYTARWSRSTNKLIVKPSDVEYKTVDSTGADMYLAVILPNSDPKVRNDPQGQAANDEGKSGQ